MKSNSQFLVLFCSVFTLLLPLNANARDVKYKDFILQLHEGDRLNIVSIKGSVKVTPNSKLLMPGISAALSPAEGAAGNGVIRVRKSGTGAAESNFDSWTFSVRREGNIVRVEAKGPDGKNEWEQQIKSAMPELHFEIDAPAVPLEIAQREGVVNVSGWKNSIHVQLVEGQTKFAKNEGSLRAQVQRGEVRIDTHKGRVEVDGFNPKVIATGIEGDTTLDNFAGETSVTTVKGNLQVTTFSGQTMAAKIGGSVDFQVGRGTLNLQDLTGSLRGKLDNGSLIAKISGEPEVNIESQEGGVSLDISPGASPTVRLQSEEGNLTAPGDLASSKQGANKVLAGRLNGGGNGSVIVKTKTGNVRVF